MKSKHQDKINELADLMASALKIECQKLVSSGAIDESDYDADEYKLAKLLMTAAMHRLKDEFAPRYGLVKELKNLIRV
jgi:hypothetical protein